MAVEAGAGGLELDVHLTRDGHVVVIHDATVDRTTGGTGAVAGMTLDELRGGRGSTASAGRRRQYPAQRGRVPTLAEVLEEFPGVADQHRHKGGRIPESRRPF